MPVMVSMFSPFALLVHVRIYEVARVRSAWCWQSLGSVASFEGAKQRGGKRGGSYFLSQTICVYINSSSQRSFPSGQVVPIVSRP